MAKYRFVGRGAVRATIIGSLMVPSTVLIVPIFILEHFLGMTNSYQGVILPLLVFPFGVYFMSIYAEEALPTALVDAGRVDGAGEFRVFHRIAIPVLTPGMVGTWNNYSVRLSIWLSQTPQRRRQPTSLPRSHPRLAHLRALKDVAGQTEMPVAAERWSVIVTKPRRRHQPRIIELHRLDRSGLR